MAGSSPAMTVQSGLISGEPPRCRQPEASLLPPRIIVRESLADFDLLDFACCGLGEGVDGDHGFRAFERAELGAEPRQGLLLDDRMSGLRHDDGGDRLAPFFVRQAYDRS